MHHNMKLRTIVGLALAIFLLSQAAMAADLTGKWSFIFYSDQGEHPRQFVLTQKGSAVEGKLGSESFTGTFQNGELKLEGEHYADEAGYKSLMKITGKLVDGKLKGEASWDTYDLTFTATKTD